MSDERERDDLEGDLDEHLRVDQEAASTSRSPRGRAGTVALVGRPNAGKSTLMNRLLAEKVSIVSDKPQTTRHRLVGILTDERGQMVFYDTPGVHRPLHQMNRQMLQHAVDALTDADVVCLLVDLRQPFGAGDKHMLELLERTDRPKVLALNKVDLVKKPEVLPRIAQYAATGQFTEMVPISAKTGDGCDELLDVLWKLLPEGAPLYDPELLTIHPERFLAAERIREKVLEKTHEELPFATAVVIERWEDDDERDLARIYATILVDRPGQKKILVGKAGSMIKAIGTAARLDLEEFLERRVYLDLQVRLEPGWRENRRILADLDRDADVDFGAGVGVVGGGGRRRRTKTTKTLERGGTMRHLTILIAGVALAVTAQQGAALPYCQDNCHGPYPVGCVTLECRMQYAPECDDACLICSGSTTEDDPWGSHGVCDDPLVSTYGANGCTCRSSSASLGYDELLRVAGADACSESMVP